MDRLSTLIGTIACISLSGTGACKDAGDGEAPPPRRRVDAVQAKAEPKTDLAGFCDHRAEGDDARSFSMPTLAGGSVPSSTGWQWVNVWATWCKPCVEELPLLKGWRSRFEEDRLPLDVVFLSVDDAQDEVDAFRSAHPQAPESHRIADREALGPWLTALGLGESTALPIHLFVDPEGKLRCVRLGQIGDRDYDNVAVLVREG